MRINAKEVGKELLGASLNIYKVAGYAIADGIWEEFVTLINETAQFTGDTAASWNVSLRGAGSFGGVRTMFPRRTRDNAVQMGHQAAVNVALDANRGKLDGATIYKKVLTSGINIWNESPGALSGVPEEGPLRDANAGAKGAFRRFKGRLETRVYNPIPFTLSLKDFNIMAESLAKGRK